jgi:hypothetical protein
VQPVGELVHKDTIVFKQGRFHRWATDIELLQDIHTDKECGPEGDYNDKNPVTKHPTGTVSGLVVGHDVQCFWGRLFHEAINLVAKRSDETMCQVIQASSWGEVVAMEACVYCGSTPHGASHRSH